MGYARWENFQSAINRTVESCNTQGINVDDHLREVAKMVKLGSGATRDVQDFMLTRYACYLIAHHGDPKRSLSPLHRAILLSRPARRSSLKNASTTSPVLNPGTASWRQRGSCHRTSTSVALMIKASEEAAPKVTPSCLAAIQPRDSRRGPARIGRCHGPRRGR